MFVKKLKKIVNKVILKKTKKYFLCLGNLFVCQDSAGATLINKKPGNKIGNAVELKYGAPTEILLFVKTSIIIG